MNEVPYHDDPVESGALEDDENAAVTPPQQTDPVESGALENDEQ